MTLEIPKGDWTFKTAEIAQGFDSHVREQLPWYDLATGIVAHYARHYIHRGGTVYDLGCSTGNFGKAIEATLKQRQARLIAIDNSQEMGKLYTGPGQFICDDLESFRPEPFCVAVCFLSLMFVGIESRRRLVSDLIDRCKLGGAIIVVDKIESDGGYLGQIASRLTLAGKVATGTKPDEIIAKEISLSGIQRPLNRSEIFGVEIFRFGEFMGFVYEKTAEQA